MATYELSLLEILKLHKKHQCILTNPAILPRGSVVVCSGNGFSNACDDVSYLGKVLYAGEPVPLLAPKGKEEHPDGATGEVYVWSYDKVKKLQAPKLPCM